MNCEKRDLTEIVSDGLWNGALATATTTAAAALSGQVEEGRPLGPINAVSHILWGDRAARRTGPSAKYTATGLLLNAAAVTSWAVVQELLFCRQQRRKSVGQALAEGATTAGIAYLTDYHLVPERFTPGFEKRLSNKSLAGIYAVLAVSLGVGALLRSRSKE
jgi:hypothetical protein